MVLAAATLGVAAPGAAAAAAPGHPPAQATSDPAAARGRAFAERRCAGCHNIGADDGPPDEGPPFRRLVGSYDSASLAERFAHVSAHGKDRMPPITFTPDERADLLAYVRTLPRE
jgi:mono/diheme cytochrome c family protein